MTRAQWMTPSEMGTSGKAWSNMTKDRASEGTVRLDRATVCGATAKPLKAPISICELGYLLNKEDVIELMLSKALPPHLAHIKSLKGLTDATLHPNPAYKEEAGHMQGQDDEPPYFCPVTNLPLNGRYPFVLIKPTGHVVSQRALKQVGGKCCPVSESPLAPTDTIAINPSEESRKEMLEQLEARRASQAGAKKAKQKAAAAGGAAVGVASAGAGASASGSVEEPRAGAAGEAASAKAKGKAPAGPMPPPAKGNAPPAAAASASAGKRPRNEWEAALAERAEGSDVYKSLFISKADRKKQEEAESANFCARGIVPSLSRSTRFGLG